MARPNWQRGDNRKREPKEFSEELIDLARVTRVVKWGRRMRFRATVVIWNRKWKVWLWIWKSNEVSLAVQKAVSDAKKKLLTVPLANWTIAHDIKLKFKWAQILIMPAWAGTWIIAWWSVRKISDLLWIENILSKRFWSTNKLTNAQAMMKALEILSRRTIISKPKSKDSTPKEVEKEVKEEISK